MLLGICVAFALFGLACLNDGRIGRCFDRPLLARFGPRSLNECAAKIDRRQVLIARTPAGCEWAECPSASCVGVGYDDRRSADPAGAQIMCFLCEQQWPAPERGIVGLAWTLWSWVCSWWPATIDGVSGWRPCPHCGAMFGSGNRLHLHLIDSALPCFDPRRSVARAQRRGGKRRRGAA